ncbi:hypothetical protein [Saccharopolyspora sp. NPDC002686]|uniref:hypothetical protein n=1 Tax=Saccharopolyspora sp. NPDC002686 TaxID=3154541 RepID=UPI00332149AD
MAVLTDVELLEQDSRASLALPGLSCDGGDWTRCPADGAWQLRGYLGRSYCEPHAAVRLRIPDRLTEPRGDAMTNFVQLRKQARDAAQARRDAQTPAPPADILARPLTPADIRKYPAYFISTTNGSQLAQQYDCPHGYRLTDSCPGCDADFDRQLA